MIIPSHFLFNLIIILILDLLLTILPIATGGDALPHHAVLLPHDRQSSHYALAGNNILLMIIMMILASLLLPLSMHYHEDVSIQNSSIRFPTFGVPLFL